MLIQVGLTGIPMWGAILDTSWGAVQVPVAAAAAASAVADENEDKKGDRIRKEASTKDRDKGPSRPVVK